MVGAHESIDAEVSVVRIVAEVATVSPVVLSRAALCEQSLVFEVPDELSRQAGILLIEVEHFPYVTHGITHRVGVLALDMRLLTCLTLS